MSGVSRRLTSKHTGPAVKRNVRHCPGQKPHRRSRSGCVTSAGLESVRHEVEEAEGDRADEGAPVHHSMIWSARTRMDCGIVRPSALAVFTLMTSSNFVGCSTGRSAGLAPLRILSTYPAARWAASWTLGP